MEDSSGRIKDFSYYVVLIYSAFALFLTVNQIFSLRTFDFYPVGYNYYFLSVYLPIVFLFNPAMKMHANRIPWYDWVFFAVSCVSAVYLGFHALESIDGGWEYKAPLIPTICGTALLILSIEAVRRAGGKILFFVCVFFGLYPIFAERMPAMFWGPNKTVIETIWAHSMGFESLIGIVMRMCANLLPGFIIFGVAMLCTGGGKFFMDFASALLGTSRGGPAKVAVVASGFFGSISGSVVSNVITTGSMTIPTMKRTGYPPHYAAAVEACASTGGCFMPPIMGAAAFLIAAFMQIPYVMVCKAALIPALLYYGALLFQVDNFAARNKLVGVDKSEVPGLWDTLKVGWFYLFAFVVLLYFMIWVRVDAWAPFFATVPLLVFAMFRKETRFTVKTFCDFVVETGRLMSFIVALIAAIGLIVGSLSISGVGNSFSRELVVAAGGNVVLLLAMGTIASFILGMGMTVSACYIFLAVVMVPALVEIGLHRLGCHLFVMYWGMLSYITPPVALGAITAAGIAGAHPMKTGFYSMRLGSVVFVLPYMFVFSPEMLLEGSASAILITAGTAFAGVWLIASAFEGWLYTIGAISLFTQIVIGACGILTFIPNYYTSAAGVVGAVITFVILKLMKPASRKEEMAEATS